MNSGDLQDTIVAQSTPVGEGAIGIIRLSGSKSKEILAKIFRGGTETEKFRSHQLYLGEVVSPETGDVLDQVLAVWMKPPSTFTGEEMVELHAHGGNIILQRLLKIVCELGGATRGAGRIFKEGLFK